MTAASSTTYKVDAQGRRVRKTKVGVDTDYFYSGSEVISEKQGSAWTDYIFFGDQRIAKQTGDAPISQTTSASTAKYTHPDHLGSTRICTDNNGSSLGACDFEPFGEVQPGTTCSIPTDYRFAGMRWDPDAGPNGLYQTWFRYYDPTQGRWMGVDALPGSPDGPQSLDRYAYVLNDPVNLFDPFGLSCETICDGIDCEDTESGGVRCRQSRCRRECQPDEPSPRDNPDNPGGGSGTNPQQPSQQPCLQPNSAQRAVIAALSLVSRLTGATVGVGVSGTAGAGASPQTAFVPGPGVSASTQIVVSPNGQAGIVTSVSGGGAVGLGAVGGVQVSVSNAANPQALAGPFGHVSVGGGYGGYGAGADYSFANGIRQLGVTLGAGVGGVGALGAGQQTSVQPFCR